MIAYVPPGYHLAPPRRALVVVRHRLQEGYLRDYQSWIRRVKNMAAGHPGFLGLQVANSLAGSHSYIITVRFAGEKDARDWAASAAWHDLLGSVRGYIDRDDEADICFDDESWLSEELTRQHHDRNELERTGTLVHALPVLSPSASVEALFRSLPRWARWSAAPGIVAATLFALLF